MLGSSSCGTVLIRALMSTMIQIIEYEVQLKDLSRMYSYIYDAQKYGGTKGKATLVKTEIPCPGPVNREIPDPAISWVEPATVVLPLPSVCMRRCQGGRTKGYIRVLPR